jgi:hypothetical protein
MAASRSDASRSDASWWRRVFGGRIAALTAGAPAPEHVIAHTNLSWTYQAAPGPTAGVVTARALEFDPRA